MEYCQRSNEISKIPILFPGNTISMKSPDISYLVRFYVLCVV